jgi:arylsulfatase A-like enzyme
MLTLRQGLRIGLVAGLVLLGAAADQASASAVSKEGTEDLRPGESRPNIVFFLVDDLGYYDIGAYGGDMYETPHVDQLARDGMRFTNAYAAAPVCSPTRASLLSGQYPARVGITDYLPGRPDAPTQPLLQPNDRSHFPHADASLAEVLKSQGYSTHFIGKWHLGGEEENSLPTDHGFMTNVGGNEMGNPGDGGYYSPYNITEIQDTVDGQYLTKRLTDEAVQVIGAQEADRPFFLMMSFYTVHSPLQAPDSLIAKYEDKMTGYDYRNPRFVLEQNPDMLSYDSTTWAEKQEWLNRPAFSEGASLPRRTTKVMRRQMTPTFAAMVDYMDHSVGRILGALRRAGLEEETLVVFYSDNGGQASPGRTSTSVAPLRAGKGWLYEGGLRVPLIVKYPGRVEPGSVSDTPVSSPDFYPTLLDLAGVPLRPQQHKDGRSFESVLLQSSSLDREELYWHWPHYSNHGQQAPAGAIRSGRYKLIEYYENNTRQLFDLQTDPEEKNNLAANRPSLADSLTQRLHEWRQRVSAEMPRPNPSYEPQEGN